MHDPASARCSNRVIPHFLHHELLLGQHHSRTSGSCHVKGQTRMIGGLLSLAPRVPKLLLQLRAFHKGGSQSASRSVGQYRGRGRQPKKPRNRMSLDLDKMHFFSQNFERFTKDAQFLCSSPLRMSLYTPRAKNLGPDQGAPAKKTTRHNWNHTRIVTHTHTHTHAHTHVHTHTHTQTNTHTHTHVHTHYHHLRCLLVFSPNFFLTVKK